MKEGNGLKLSDYVWQYISELGVRHVFMFPGGGAMHLVDSLGRNPNLKHVTLLHEQACVMAAETYARIDYNLGAALVTTGPGGTNAVTGVAAAWLESTPVIVISGQAKRSDLKEGYGVRQRGNQEIGIVDIVSSITKYAVTVKDPQKIKYHLDRALHEAMCGRPGPVWIDIPLDVQSAEIIVDGLESYEAEHVEDYSRDRLTAQVSRVISLLKNVQRPVLIAGQGIERGNGKEILRSLLETVKFPVLFSWIAAELLEYGHPYNLGSPGMVAPRYSNFTMQEADLIIAVGTRLDPAMIGYDQQDFAPSAKKVIVDIDKYELDKFSFDIEEKVQADATEFLKEMLRQLDGVTLPSYSAWCNRCQEWKRHYPVLLSEYDDDSSGVNPYYFMDRLFSLLANDDVIIPGSSGACIDIYWLCAHIRRQQRTLATGALGSMGYGLPAAIGACLASDKRTICVEGDGSIQLNIQELASIKGMGLPIKIFVNGNGGYLSIMNMQKNHFQGRLVGANPASGLNIADLCAVASAYGLKTFTIRRHSELESVVKQTLSSNGPALCYVSMKENVTIQPRVQSRVSDDGSMVSGKLRDLWPFLD